MAPSDYWIIGQENIAREVIVKLHGRCNLDCGYCYVYKHADQSWRSKPKAMSREVINRLAVRLGEYMREHRMPFMRVVIHGGEPLLAGVETIEYLVRTLRAAVPDRQLSFIMQTNGVLLTPAVLDACLRHQIHIGVSLDGDRTANKNRPFHNGKSSYDDVMAGLRLFERPEYRELLSGILAVIDLANDPVATYDHLSQFNVRIDFLLPLGNWDKPPPGSWPLQRSTSYGDWLIAVFDRMAEVKDGPEVRLINQMVGLLYWHAKHGDRPLPQALGIEAIGPWVVGALVVEVDGSYELLDGYKTTAFGQAQTGLNVFDHRMTRALIALLTSTQDRGINTGATECQSCPIFKFCGGGLYIHRFKQGGYDNRSIFCQDLAKVIYHIADWLKKRAEAKLRSEAL